jgi:hypothetical protein
MSGPSESDPSADAGDGVAGQGLVGPARNIQTDQLHRQESDKLKGSREQPCWLNAEPMALGHMRLGSHGVSRVRAR